MSDIKKVVLAYSGGLDTSVILKWLQDTYQCEIVTFTADLGQGEEIEPARSKALKFGIKPENILIQKKTTVKVGDFGLVKEIRHPTPFTEYVATRWYRAPEVILSWKQYRELLKKP